MSFVLMCFKDKKWPLILLQRLKVTPLQSVISLTVWENYMALSTQAKNMVALWPWNSAPRCASNGKAYICSLKVMYEDYHRRDIHNSPNLEICQMSKSRTDTLWYVNQQNTIM